MNNYHIKIYTTLTEKLINEWENLWCHAENANVHNSYQRFLISIKTYNTKEYQIHACYKGKELVAIMPVCAYRCFGINVVGSVTNKVYYNTSFLIKNYNLDLFNYFFEKIIPKSNFYITRIDSKSAKILKNLFPKALLSITAGVPYLDLDNDPLRFIPQSALKKVKKITDKNPGKFELKVYNDNLQNLLEIMFSIEQRSSKKLRSIDIFSKEDRRDYFKNLVNYGNKLANLAFLYYNNLPIAYSFNLNYGSMLHCSQKAHLNEYKKFMPGKILAIMFFENLKGSKIKRVDLGAGVSSFKLEFTPHYYFLYDMYYSKNKLVMFWWRTLNFIRRLKKNLVPEKFTIDTEFLFKTL